MKVYAVLDYVVRVWAVATGRARLHGHADADVRVSGARHHPLVRAAIVGALAAAVLSAQPPMPMVQPSKILEQYRNLMGVWFAVILPIGKTLFWLLAGIEFAYFCITAFLEGADLMRWGAGMVKKLMMIGIFYAILLNAGIWIPAIVDGLSLVGLKASGFNVMLSPSDIFSTGCWICGLMMNAAEQAGWLGVLNGSGVALLFATFTTFIAFLLITVVQLMASVQGYLVVGMGAIMLALGPTRWTAPYAERYIGLAIATGLRLMVVNMLIGAGMLLALGWIDLARQIPNDPSPVMGSLEIAGAAFIFLCVVWEIPKLVSSVIGGTPNFSGLELLAFGSTVAGIAASGAMLAGRTIAGAAAGGPAGGAAGAGSSTMSVAQASQVGANGATGAARAATPAGAGANGSARAVPPPKVGP